MSRRKAAAGIVSVILAAVASLALALPDHPTAAVAKPAVHRSAELPPMPALHPKVVEPTVSVATATHPPVATTRRHGKDQVQPPAGPRGEGASRGTGSLGGSVEKARALPNGVAVPPLEAPQAVRDIIQAG